ncbi:hypothetical protein B0J14DRAFT_350795 [Halenospora varia]|nr:hypothetical protein B0J14DRAFT_350795 [Halenospora varia]
MSNDTSDIGHERHEPMDFIVTFVNTQTRMVVRRVNAHTSWSLDGSVGPIAWPGPLQQSSDRSQIRRTSSSRSSDHELTRSPSSRRDKGIKFVERLYQPGANVMPNILCLKCQSILLKSYLLNGQADKVNISETLPGPLQRTERLESFQHYSTYEELEKSCHTQCHLYHLLWDILEEEICDVDEGDFNDVKQPVVVQVRTSGDPSGTVQVNVALQECAHRRIEDNDRRCIRIHRLPLTLDGDEPKNTQIQLPFLRLSILPSLVYQQHQTQPLT